MNPNENYDISIDGCNPDTTLGSRQVNPRRNNQERRQRPDRRQAEDPRRRQQRPQQRHAKPRRNSNGFIDFLKDKRTHLACGITLIVTAIVMFICVISYLKSGDVDQSVAMSETMTQIADSGEAVENAGGALGVTIAHYLLVDALGLSSFVGVFYLITLGLALAGAFKCRFWALTFKCLFTAIALSIILGLFTYNVDSVVNWGGNHGHYVNQWLFHISDALGAYAVSLILISILCCIYVRSIKNGYRRLKLIVKAIMPKRAPKEEAPAANAEDDMQLDGEPSEANTADAEHKTAPIISFDEDEGINSGYEHKPIVPLIPAQDKPAAAGNTPRQGMAFSIDQDDDDVPENFVPEVPVTPVDHAVAAGQAGETQFDITVNTIEQRDDSEEVEDLSNQPDYDHRAELSRYVFPPINLLIDRPTGEAMDAEEQQENKDLIIKTLLDYKIPISRIEATVGPTVTLYEIVPAEGVRIAQIKRLEDDIALSLAALGIRIIAPIPGKGTVGIEVPNRDPKTVSMYSVINSRKFAECKMALPMAMGATISNDIFIADLAKMPHLLVAGATGQGKSVGLNCIIASLLYKKHPTELKFVLIDPKMVEFSLYKRLERHYLAKLPDESDAIITDPSKAVATLNSLCIEMDKRYELLSLANVRSLEEYNRKFSQHRLNPEKGHRYMPYIVMVVDEFADLIMTAGKEISMPIARIAQKARAVGMHMIIATQRPSTDVITGMIKANFPGRIAFRVSQRIDSMTILDRPGANQLIGRGDMLFSHNGVVERVQCAFIDTEEVDAIADHIDNQIGFESAYLLPEPTVEAPDGSVDLSKRDDKFDECARFVVQQSTASTSSLQRRFGIGYNKAGKIMDQMQAAGIVGPADGSKPRAVLVDPDTLERILANN
jgi:S-DNA-T family DNA segregation ATPase FtsK/SpoIIIE